MTPLRRWRARLELTQVDAARLLGLTERQYHRLETGVTPLRVLHRLAAAAIERRLPPLPDD